MQSGVLGPAVPPVVTPGQGGGPHAGRLTLWGCDGQRCQHRGHRQQPLCQPARVRFADVIRDCRPMGALI